jgi:hypothetical protein
VDWGFRARDGDYNIITFGRSNDMFDLQRKLTFPRCGMDIILATLNSGEEGLGWAV